MVVCNDSGSESDGFTDEFEEDCKRFRYRRNVINCETSCTWKIESFLMKHLVKVMKKRKILLKAFSLVALNGGEFLLVERR